MKKLLSIAIVASLPSMASAQNVDVEGMQASLSMLELNVDRILDANGFDEIDPTELDLGTIVEIISVIRDDDNSADRQQIQTALDRWRPPSQ